MKAQFPAAWARRGAVLAALCWGLSGAVQAGSYEDFFKAIIRDDGAAIQKLLARGFDVNTRDASGSTGLYLALKDSELPSLRAAQALIEAPGIDVNVLNAKGESPLMLTALRGQLALAQALIAKGADVNKTGWTPLHYASSGGHADMIRLLLEHSAYIDAESPNGSTPLMMAAMYGNDAAVELLLEEGAAPSLKNQLGLSALQFAQKAGRTDSANAIAAAIRRKRPAGQW